VDIDVDTDLSWTAGDPNPGDILTYDVYFGSSSPPPQVVTGQSATTYDPGSMNPNTQYYWKIISWDNHGASTTGSEWTFTTENNPPDEPSDPDPQHGDTDVSIDADLSWTGGDPDPGDTVTYDVYFGTSSPPPQVATGQSATTYDPGIMEYETIYYWQIVVLDNHGGSTDGPIWEFTTELEPKTDLDCDGVLNWEELEYGEVVTGEFTVENVGDPGTLLDWEIESYPDWGNWVFTPESGTGLTPEDGPYTVQVLATAPSEGEGEFTGEVKIVSVDDSSDFCTIDATMSNAVSQSSQFMRFFERLMECFPVLGQILQIAINTLMNF
jgi:hypothetical protein